MDNTATYFFSMLIFSFFFCIALGYDTSCGEYHGVSVTMRGSDGNLFWSLYKQNQLKSISGAEFTKVCINFDDESGDYTLDLILITQNDSGNSSAYNSSYVDVSLAVGSLKSMITYNTSNFQSSLNYKSA
jgi:hypothetical protein